MRSPIHLQSCPFSGKQTFRFLGDARGIIVHHIGGQTHGCIGDQCKKHQEPKYKAYAPAQVYRRATEGFRAGWFPVVVELTPSVIEVTGLTCLRGQAWQWYRVGAQFPTKRRKHGPSMCCAELLTVYDAVSLPPGFGVVDTVERVLKTSGIAWDIPPDDYMQSYGEVSEDDCPPSPPHETEIPASNGTLADENDWNAFRARMKESTKKGAGQGDQPPA